MFLGKSSILSIICTWFLVVAGFPLYYLMPDRDWNYEYWEAPVEIVQSSKIAENPGEKYMQGVYARIFIVRPSTRNLSNFRAAGFTSCAHPMDELLREYALPGPYRYGHWYGHGSMDYVECGNGLVLVRDYSRNKGGLMSSRMGWETVREHYPLHFVIRYLWAWTGIGVLLLTPIALIPGLFLYSGIRIISSFFNRSEKETEQALVSFPVLVYEKDDRSIYLCNSLDEVRAAAESYDIENDEYLFFDAEGYPVKATLAEQRKVSLSYEQPMINQSPKVRTLILQHIEICKPAADEALALARYSDCLKQN